MARPDFLIIGAPKAGTTSLWDLLRQHPQICMSSEKEPRFFSHEEQYSKGWSWYESLFQPKESIRVIGEASPHYSMVNVFPRAVERISQHLPDVRIVYCVRDPLTAIPSFWKQLCSHGLTIPGRDSMPRQFESAVANFKPMVELVRYWHNLGRFRDFVPDNRIHLMFFEDFTRDPASTLNICCEFLGVDPLEWSKENQPRNSSSNKTTRPEWIRRLSRSNLWTHGKHLVPMPLREPLRRIGLRRLPEVRLSEGMANHIKDRVGEDSAQILAYGEKSPEFWSISASGLVSCESSSSGAER